MTPGVQRYACGKILLLRTSNLIFSPDGASFSFLCLHMNWASAIQGICILNRISFGVSKAKISQDIQGRRTTAAQAGLPCFGLS